MQKIEKIIAKKKHILPLKINNYWDDLILCYTLYKLHYLFPHPINKIVSNVIKILEWTSNYFINNFVLIEINFYLRFKGKVARQCKEI